MKTLAILLLCATTAMAQSQSPRYESRPLTDVLRDLQARGLRVVFSSEIVTPAMRVIAEPRATAPRQILDEVLRPHRLKAEDGPGGVIQIVRARAARAPDGGRPRADKRAGGAVDESASTGGGTYSERVTVFGAPPEGQDQGIGFKMRLGARELQALPDGITDDPVRAVQALPHVASGDDLRSEFSVRGSPYRQVGVVVDGVATHWLQHTVHGAGDTGSLGMLNSLVVEQATLQAGAYPHRYGDWLGPQLELTLREGSRSATRFRGAAGGTSATLTGEGPFKGSTRGSWLFAVRQSYREWPNQLRGEVRGKPFGFADAQAKLVFDVRPGQQASVTFLGGRSRVDERGSGGPDDLAVATNQASVLSAGWRSTFAPSLVVRQRASFVMHRFADTTQAGADAGQGRDRAVSYHADITRALRSAIVEGGVDARRLHGSRMLLPIDAFRGSAIERAAYVNAKWSPLPRLTITPGVRTSSSTLVQRRATSRWILGEWLLRPGWTLNASAGVFQALPDLSQVLGGAGAPDLRPERASLFDVGIEQHIKSSVRWQVTFFRRRERNILRAPDVNPRLVDGVLIMPPPATVRYENALTGTSRGVELLLERRSAATLSGWIAYSYGTTRHTDAARAETFYADFDQRHGVNATGVYRVSTGTMLSVKFRGGTNFPVPGYFTARDGALFAGDRRNEVRLPTYARVDARASHTFDYAGRRLTLFVEVLNALDRRNVGVADGFIRPGTAEAAGFTRRLFPRLPSAGLVIEF